MKKLLFGCTIAVYSLSMSVASADDFYYPTQYDPCCCGPDFGCCGQSFEGFYIGGNLGVFSNTAHRNDLDGFLTDNAGWSTINTNVTAGLQLGYDWQCNCTVLGLVVDWNWVNTRNRFDDSPAIDDTNYHRSDLHWFTTIRARAGATICNTLLYITGGAAVTRVDVNWADLPTEFQSHITRWGWTGGFGAEYNLGCNWSFGAEFLFLQFDDKVRTFTDAGGTSFAFGHSDSAWVGRFILNYRFGDLCCLW